MCGMLSFIMLATLQFYDIETKSVLKTPKIISTFVLISKHYQPNPLSFVANNLVTFNVAKRASDHAAIILA